MTKKYRSFLLLLSALLMILPCVAIGTPAPSNAPVGVSVFYKCGLEKLQGATLDLYLVAQKDSAGNWKTTAPFDRYPVRIDEDWQDLPATLEGYVLRDKLPAAHSGNTNINGFVRLPKQTGSMKHGLYLLVGRPHIQNDKYYTAQPVMLELPYLSEDGTTWRYDALVNIKCESDEIPETPLTVTRKVLKVWNDAEHIQHRPEKITVELLENGEVADSVELNSQNLWRWEWTNLDAQSRWHVVEKEIDGYSVNVVQQGITFVITNTFEEPAPTPTTTPTPTPSSTAGITPTPSPLVTDTPSPVVTSTPRPSVPTLPQTGQLWWPVPVLACAGLFFMILGLLRRRSEEDEEE